MSDASTQTYTGSCHCGRVRYHVDLTLDEAHPAITCNCSMCGRSGSMLAFVPESAFTLEQGADALADYQFNKHVIHHLFCTTCGIKPFARGATPKGETMVAINVRCLEGVDLATVPTKAVDGKHF